MSFRIFFNVLLFSTVTFFSLVIHAEIDHLSIRGHKSGELIYESGNRKYYLTTLKSGDYYLVAVHDVGTDGKLVERIFQAPNGQHNPFGQKEYIYSDKDLEIFRRHILPELMKRSNIAHVYLYHYNARVLLQDNSSDMESPILITKYRISNPMLVYKKKETQGQWYFYYSSDHLDTREHGLYDPKIDFVSVNEALQYRKLKTKNIASVDKQTKKYLKQKINAKKKLLAAKVAIKKADRQSGIVYKSKHFWQSFVDFDEAQHAFEGNFSGLTSNIKFMLQYGNFQSVYYNTCKTNLPANSVVRGYSSQVVVSDGWGNEKYREQPIENKIYIAPRFVDKYDEYYDSVNTYMGQQTLKKVWAMQKSIRAGLKKYKATLSGATAEAMKEYLASEPIIQMMRFFKNTGCNSAAMYQMRENLWRAAHSKPSLQAAGFRIPNAENESVSIEDSISKKTIYQACIDNNSSSISNEKYCSCFSKEARKVMTMKELSYFSEDFSRYYRDVEGKLDTYPSADDRAWVLYKPKYNCAK